MTPPDPALRERLRRHGQEHLLRFWDELDEPGRRRLEEQLAGLDLERVDRLVETVLHGDPPEAGELGDVRPPMLVPLAAGGEDRAALADRARLGERALRAGELAVVMVAGGQGTRLGYDGPKGTFPLGPLSGATLFQIHAEKLAALAGRYGRPLPLYIMTSPQNHAETAAFFAEHSNFGLEHVRLFVQGQMPAVDRERGRILLAGKGELALSPDGHGGTIRALAAPGPEGAPSCLEEMAERDVCDVFYLHVDNPLVHIADPAFLGVHRAAEAEFSAKVVEKVDPAEKVGLFVEVDGTPRVIEYSDLPDELAERRAADGRLELRAGRIGVELFDVGFLERLASGGAELPVHRALKRVPYVDDEGRRVQPEEPNAVKFEMFIFDALPLAQRYAILETQRETEFEPVKNAEGPDSPASARRAMTRLFATWLEQAGARVRRDEAGEVPFDIEISPLVALDASELATRIEPGTVVGGPLLLR